jgi:hypothetical protein
MLPRDLVGPLKNPGYFMYNAGSVSAEKREPNGLTGINPLRRMFFEQ